MEKKKTERANLEKGKSVNLLMGIVVAMAILFVSFEWGTTEVTISLADRLGDVEWTDEIPITITEPTPPPPPPPPTAVAEILTVVEDDAIVDSTPIITSEDTQENPQEEVYLPPVIEEKEEEDANQIHTIVEEMPAFPGGNAALMKFISQAINYPVVAQENGVFGRVTCSFVINTDGSIVDIEVLRGVDPSLDKEAVRVIGTMPKWKPGMQRDKPVRVRYTLPIVFRLQ
ncbi:protein TonB [Parabacteroides sp. PFB2-12]|uniref:energy transducer TonB n=1 Tax=unclassified Parabacteroides TaxID=2649774 RepID=UPI0024738FE5|nr:MULTISPECIES: energy transducer TonB [unclassified Parabacteroides]MDH6343860.1 protein TonB [Parabacteroides sp. PM6-13]MDH6391222.1 protein TonB [Parabacteroides sp. PFB2-12]